MALLKKKPYLEMVFLALISAVVYLPYAAKLTYYLDDWYYIYDGLIAGPNIFHTMFGLDRPARGYFFDIYFSIFGPDPLPYHLGAYLWRLLAGGSALWLFNILWPDRRRFNFFMALLFILYPGYSWWISAIEYQPMIASLAIQVLSIAFTLKGVRSTKLFERIIYQTAAILTGWVYISLVDYAIGMEAFRFFCVYLLVSQEYQASAFLKKITGSLKAWGWNVVIPVGFIFWRLFLFESQRKATDLDLQLGKFIEAPTDSLWGWLLNTYNSFVNVGINAWGKQFYIRLAGADFTISFGMMAAVGVVILLLLAGYKLIGQPADDSSPRSPAGNAALLGFASLLFGVLPVVVLNRFVNLTIYSHYGLPASLASAMLLTGLIYYLFLSENTRAVVVSAFIVVSVLTHLLIAEKAMVLQNSLEDFWRQASWRIPQLRPDTTLVTLYPYPEVADNDLGLPEPANLIYFPQPADEIPVRYPVSTLMPTDGNIDLILTGQHRKTEGYRTHKMIINYGEILILVQPSANSCVRVINGMNYVLSRSDPKNIEKIAPHSDIEIVRSRLDPLPPQKFAFGMEPEHGWCYYFEKADLAVQNQDWEEAARLGDEALLRELNPNDAVEWFPFLQAYAMLDDEQKVRMVSSYLNTDAYLGGQICTMIDKQDTIFVPSGQMKVLIHELFCD